jgi:hypothetical protein
MAIYRERIKRVSRRRLVHGTPGQVARIPGLRIETWGTHQLVSDADR